MIGICGTGRMGAGMLRRLLAAGHPAAGYDVRPAAGFAPLPVTNDAAAFAAPLTTLVTVVRDAAETDAALAALLPHARGLERLVLSSTLPPSYVRDLSARLPVPVVDAPMSGAQAGAEAGTLSFMLGGEAAQLDAIAPYLGAMGAHAHRMGGVGMGMTAKVLNNLIAASSMVATRTALDWGAAAGLDEARLLALIETSSGQNWLASGMDRIEFARDGFEAGNSVAVLAKDVGCAMDAAPEGAETDLPELLMAKLRALRPM